MRLGVIVVVAALLVGLAHAQATQPKPSKPEAAPPASEAAPSTPEERKQITELAKKLEQNPLDRSLTKDTRRLFQRIIDVPDITVTLCNDVMPWLKEEYKYAPELSMIYTVAAAAYVIENPAADPGVSSWAGLESALRAYQNIVKKDPKAKSRVMERALDARDMGTLERQVKDGCGPEKQPL